MSAPTATALPVGQVDNNPPLPPSVFVNAALGDGSLTMDQRNTIYQYVASRTGETVAEVQTKFAALGQTTGLDNALANVYIALVQGKTSTAFGAPGSNLPTVPTISNPLTSVEDFLSKLSNGNTWIRVGEFAVGFLMVGIAIAAIVRQSSGASVSSVVKKATPVGRVAGTVASGVKGKASSVNQQYSRSANTSHAPYVEPNKPTYEGKHDRHVSKHSGIDLSAPVL